MAKIGQKMAKNRPTHFFWKKLFCYFFITYQGLTPCKKSKKSKERILRSGVRTDEITDKGKSIEPTSKVGGFKKLSILRKSCLPPSLARIYQNKYFFTKKKMATCLIDAF